MSAAVREAIAAACNTVPGVDVAPYFRQQPTPGAGMVRYAGTEQPNRLGRMNTWQVVIFLNQDLGTAERWIDDHLGQLLAVLTDSRELHDVLRASPQQLSLDTGTVPVVVIEGTREGA